MSGNLSRCGSYSYLFFGSFWGDYRSNFAVGDKLSPIRLGFVIGHAVPCAIAVAHRLDGYPWDGLVHNVNNFSVALTGAGVGTCNAGQLTLFTDAVQRLAVVKPAANAVGCLVHWQVSDGHGFLLVCG